MPKNPSLYILLTSRIARSVAAGMLAVTFPYFVLNELHDSIFFLGTIFAIATLFTAFFGLFFGTMTDIWGRKKTLFMATALLPFACFLLWYSKSTWILFVSAVLGGFSATGSLAGGGVGGAVQPIQNTILADLVPGSKRTYFFSLFAFLNGIAAAAGTVFVKFISYDDIFFSAGLLSLMGTIIILFMENPEIRGDFTKLESKLVIGKFTLTGLLNGVSQGLITPFLIPFFILVYKVPKDSMSSYAFISGVLASVSLLLAPFVDKKLGFVKSITYTRGISTILLLLLPIVRLFPLAIFIYFITPALRVVSIPIQQRAITSLVKEDQRGRALGINQVVRLIGSSVATEVAGGFLSTSFIFVPFYLYGIMMGANIFLYRIFFKNEENK